MSETPGDRIRAAIADHGPITFSEYMEHALYGPGGFYERPPVGEHGHFVTAPHIHPVFADLVRFALGELRDALGDPDPFTIVELGAGDGTLAGQLLASYAEVEPTPVDYAAVEISSGARHELDALGVRVAERIEDLPRVERACVFANEVLDNLPFRRVRATHAGSVEVRVALADDGALVETEAVLDDELAAVAPETLEPETEAVVPTGALALVDRLAAWVRRGYVLLVDYGAEGPGGAGEVHGYRGHRVLADVLADPGSADITAGVDFGAVARRAQAAGMNALGLVTQRDALLALGFERWNEGQLGRQTEALGSGRGRDAVGAWEGRGRAGILVDPGGLGRLRWLLLSTPDLPVPDWLQRALARRPAGD